MDIEETLNLSYRPNRLIALQLIRNRVLFCLFFFLITLSINFSSSIAATTDCQETDWSAFTSIYPVNDTDGEPIIDAEGADDASTGEASATGNQSFASNCEATGNVGSSGCDLSNCNPSLPSGRGCGLEPSFYFDCTTVGTVGRRKGDRWISPYRI